MQDAVYDLNVAEHRIEFILERLLIDTRIGGFIENPPMPFQIVALLNQSQRLRFIVLALLKFIDQNHLLSKVSREH